MCFGWNKNLSTSGENKKGYFMFTNKVYDLNRKMVTLFLELMVMVKNIIFVINNIF